VDEVVALAPDVVVFEAQAALKSPLRAALPAKTRVYVDEPAPFGSLESPPSLNRLVGALALAKILHPDRAPAAPDYPAKIRETFFGPAPAGLTFTPLLTN
jgi:iron complex transport system substrate-binding protein